MDSYSFILIVNTNFLIPQPQCTYQTHSLLATNLHASATFTWDCSSWYLDGNRLVSSCASWDPDGENVTGKLNLNTCIGVPGNSIIWQKE